ncbi:thioredoxin family protein [Streptomyces flaveolus]|uniref:thioredoxin family protein n=1 Tax=Streptomyces flaveolus TaxID=67297 RepID=UPI0033AED4F5
MNRESSPAPGRWTWGRPDGGRPRGVLREGRESGGAGDVRVGGRNDGERRDGPRLDAADLGAELGARATLVQFSSAFCAPCRATRRVLGEVAGMVPGVAHVELDAEARLELVRALDVLKTPTVLVLDADGRVVRRAVGLPRKADVIAALGEAV